MANLIGGKLQSFLILFLHMCLLQVHSFVTWSLKNPTIVVMEKKSTNRAWGALRSPLYNLD